MGDPSTFDHRTIAEFHATRESGSGCPGSDGGPHYFAFQGRDDYRSCIDCGEPEVVVSK
jgi:hypothetical protein